MFESDDFIQDATQWPDIWLLVVGFFLANFRREVIRSSDCSLCVIISALEDASDSKIPDFNFTPRSQENILGFEIPVKDFAVMNVFQSKANLDEPVKDLGFALIKKKWCVEIKRNLREPFSGFFLFGYFGIHISSISVIHDNAQISAKVNFI